LDTEDLGCEHDYDGTHLPANICSVGMQSGASWYAGVGLGDGGRCGTCGNGSTEFGEQCEDGNLRDGDGCSSACKYETCGNGQSSRTLQALRFSWLGRSCAVSPTEDIVFTLNGVDVARSSLADSCDCAPGVQTVEVTDPSLLALGNGGTIFGLRTAGEIAWASVTFQTPTGTWTPKLWDMNND
jgi:cysteine-rich repeat protein